MEKAALAYVLKETPNTYCQICIIHCSDSSLNDRARQLSLNTLMQHFAHLGLRQAYTILVSVARMAETLQ